MREDEGEDNTDAKVTDMEAEMHQYLINRLPGEENILAGIALI